MLPQYRNQHSSLVPRALSKLCYPKIIIANAVKTDLGATCFLSCGTSWWRLPLQELVSGKDCLVKLVNRRKAVKYFFISIHLGHVRYKSFRAGIWDLVSEIFSRCSVHKNLYLLT